MAVRSFSVRTFRASARLKPSRVHPIRDSGIRQTATREPRDVVMIRFDLAGVKHFATCDDHVVSGGQGCRNRPSESR